ncbi:hypothetical protein [Amycolatopsis japonica]|uniref:hypothetical protein n=1 Tax=Amycolatopsis japonica TaxID=208439 RepID=UPI0033F19F06
MINVYKELDGLSKRLKPFDRPKKHREIEQILERQKIVLLRVKDLPGYSRTSEILFPLMVEIDLLLADLEKRLTGTALRLIWRSIGEIRSLLNGAVPEIAKKALPPGPSGE